MNTFSKDLIPVCILSRGLTDHFQGGATASLALVSLEHSVIPPRGLCLPIVSLHFIVGSWLTLRHFTNLQLFPIFSWRQQPCLRTCLSNISFVLLMRMRKYWHIFFLKHHFWLANLNEKNKFMWRAVMCLPHKNVCVGGDRRVFVSLSTKIQDLWSEIRASF